MRFVDTATFTVTAGSGGSGAVSFRREKYEPKGGPDGGNGGRGGDIIFEASVSCQTLMDVAIKQHYKAGSGEPGRGRNMTGSSGRHCIINIPCGTLIYDAKTNVLLGDLTRDKMTLCVATGGRGGLGNASFRSSRNQIPRKAQPGEDGESVSIRLELRLIAAVGLVGLPNAGKSTLLRAITLASPKIGAYPFTTKKPNLGVLKLDDKEVVFADIPGLIEGASAGQGLGNTFLRHVSRTRVLIHLVSVFNQTPESCLHNHQLILNELKKSSLSFQDKPIITVLTQIDTILPDQLLTFQAAFKRHNIPISCISALTKNGLSDLISDILNIYETTH